MEFELLNAVSPDERRAVLAQMTRRRYRKGETLFHQDDLGDVVHFIVKGTIAIRGGTPRGDIATFAILGPGETFGEQALLTTASRRTATAVAMESVETMALHGHEFDELRNRYPGVERILTSVLAAQVRRLSDHLVDALYLPAEKRLMRRLLDLVQLYGQGKSPVVIPLTQDDLSTLAGISRPTANRVLQELEAEGAVELGRGRLTVLDAKAIAQRAR